MKKKSALILILRNEITCRNFKVFSSVPVPCVSNVNPSDEKIRSKEKKLATIDILRNSVLLKLSFTQNMLKKLKIIVKIVKL